MTTGSWPFTSLLLLELSSFSIHQGPMMSVIAIYLSLLICSPNYNSHAQVHADEYNLGLINVRSLLCTLDDHA